MSNLPKWSSGLRISESDFKHRKKTCLACKLIKDGGFTCGSCGCPSTNFWFNPESECPIGKFKSINTGEETGEEPFVRNVTPAEPNAS